MFRFVRNMNKKALITICFAAVIFLSGLGYVVISNILNAFQPVSMPEFRQTVSGNGGQAVIVGDHRGAYIYFIGNFVETASIEHRQNEYNRVTHGAIFRARLNGGAAGSLTHDDAQRALEGGFAPTQLANKELVVPKIAGHERSALFVFDRHLIYTSPNNTRDRYGRLQTERLDFFRVDLDGRNHRLIYTAESPNVRLEDFTVTSHNGEIFLLIMDGSNLRRVRVSDRDFGQVTLISHRAETFAFPIVTAYSTGEHSLTQSFSGIMRFVYFTENQGRNDISRHGPGNVVKRFDILHGTTTELMRGGEYRVSILSLSNRRLMYTKERAISLPLATAPALFITRPVSGGQDMTRAAFYPEGQLYRNFNSNNFKVLSAGTQFGDRFMMSTEFNSASPQEAVFVRLTQANRMLLYHQTVLNNTAGTNVAEETRRINNVREIIAITRNTIYFIYLNGEIGFVSLYGTIPHCDNDYEEGEWCEKEVMMLGEHVWQPTSLTRLSFFSFGNLSRIFFIDTFYSDEGSRNFAMMAELGGNGNQVSEFVLGRVPNRYLSEEQRS